MRGYCQEFPARHSRARGKNLTHRAKCAINTTKAMITLHFPEDSYIGVLCCKLAQTYDVPPSFILNTIIETSACSGLLLGILCSSKWGMEKGLGGRELAHAVTTCQTKARIAKRHQEKKEYETKFLRAYYLQKEQKQHDKLYRRLKVIERRMQEAEWSLQRERVEEDMDSYLYEVTRQKKPYKSFMARMKKRKLPLSPYKPIALALPSCVQGLIARRNGLPYGFVGYMIFEHLRTPKARDFPPELSIPEDIWFFMDYKDLENLKADILRKEYAARNQARHANDTGRE